MGLNGFSSVRSRLGLHTEQLESQTRVVSRKVITTIRYRGLICSKIVLCIFRRYYRCTEFLIDKDPKIILHVKIILRISKWWPLEGMLSIMLEVTQLQQSAKPGLELLFSVFSIFPSKSLKVGSTTLFDSRKSPHKMIYLIIFKMITTVS